MDVVAECRPAVQALVARLLRRRRDDPDVEDCTHETFRRVLESRDKLRADQPVRPWILGIARHVALDALRAEYRRRGRSVDGAVDERGEGPVDRLVDPRSGPELLAQHGERAQGLQRALRELPEQQREALLLFHVEELGYREIAERLGVPVGTVGTWVLRARQGILEVLGESPVSGEVRRGES